MFQYVMWAAQTVSQRE